MNSLEFIEKEIEYKNENIKHWENQLERYPNSDVFIRCIEVCKEQLQTLQSIKAKLEAWEVVKQYCDYQDSDRFNCIPEGFYLIEPIKGKDFLIVRKALEVKHE